MREELKNKIDELVAAIPQLGTQQGRDASDRLMSEALQLAATPKEKREAGAYLRHALQLRHKRADVDVAQMLGELADVLPYSYIAKKYFGKTRPWLSQRINRSVVNGKEACFTGKELMTLAEAAKDLSLQLSDFHNRMQETLRP